MWIYSFKMSTKLPQKLVLVEYMNLKQSFMPKVYVSCLWYIGTIMIITIIIVIIDC